MTSTPVPSAPVPSSSPLTSSPSLTSSAFSTTTTTTTTSPHYASAYSSDYYQVLNKNPLLNRIGLEPIKRIALITASASFWGFVLGGVIGSRQSGMQYLAENSHRLPKTMEGWYFYHKKKNYRMIWGAVSKGVVYSTKTGVMVGLFEVLEASADFYRGGADLMNSVVAGVASGGIFSLANKLPRQSSKHAIMLGAGYGLVSGGLQDLSSFLKGTPVWYLPQSLKDRSLALKLPAGSSEDQDP